MSNQSKRRHSPFVVYRNIPFYRGDLIDKVLEDGFIITEIKPAQCHPCICLGQDELFRCSQCRNMKGTHCRKSKFVISFSQSRKR